MASIKREEKPPAKTDSRWQLPSSIESFFHILNRRLQEGPK